MCTFQLSKCLHCRHDCLQTAKCIESNSSRSLASIGRLDVTLSPDSDFSVNGHCASLSSFYPASILCVYLPSRGHLSTSGTSFPVPPPVLIVSFCHLQQVVSTSVICISRLSIGKSERAAAGASHWATPAAQLTSAPFRNGWHNVNDMLQVSVADCAPLGGSRRLPAAPPAPKRFIKKSRAKKQNIPAGRRHQGSMDFSDEEFTRGNRRNICWFFVCSSGFRCV